MLDIVDTGLTIGVSTENTEMVGLREDLDPDASEKLFEILRSPAGEEQRQWSRRFKGSQDRPRAGDIFILAGLVWDFIRQMRAKVTLALTEKDMLQYARRPIVTETAMSTTTGPSQAETTLDMVLAEPVRHTTMGVRA